MVEEHNIQRLYQIYRFPYDVNLPFPQMLVALARHQGKIADMAQASADCKAIRQIGVEVLYLYRGKGLSAALVNMLTLEILNRGYIPYYLKSDSNVLSMHAAIRAGYIPAWIRCYKTRPDDIIG